MKVLDIYTKKDMDLITYGGKNICKLMDDFFKKFPISYRENYDRNLETLEIQRVDEMPNEFDSAQYLPTSNVLLFKSFSAIPHELMHLASSNLKNDKNSICRAGIYSVYENGMLEGMTEYLATLVTGDFPIAYFFESFCVSMLSDIDNIFEPYFIPDYNKFVSLFPNKKDIYSLMYALDFYHENIKIIDDSTSDYDIKKINDSIRSTIDCLIDIELSFDKNMKQRKIYVDKFMDLISGPDIDAIVGDVYPDYVNYAHHEVKKRILRRK